MKHTLATGWQMPAWFYKFNVLSTQQCGYDKYKELVQHSVRH